MRENKILDTMRNAKSSVQIRIYDDNSSHVAYKRLTVSEVGAVLKLLNMNLDKKINEF